MSVSFEIQSINCVNCEYAYGHSPRSLTFLGSFSLETRKHSVNLKCGQLFELIFSEVLKSHFSFLLLFSHKMNLFTQVYLPLIMSGLKYATYFGRGKEWHFRHTLQKKKFLVFVSVCKEKHPHFNLLFASEKQEVNLGKLREKLKELCLQISPLLNTSLRCLCKGVILTFKRCYPTFQWQCQEPLGDAKDSRESIYTPMLFLRKFVPQ